MLTIVIIMTIINLGDAFMSKRACFFLMSLLFLGFGAMIYILFRPNTHIAVICDSIIDLDLFRQSVSIFGCNFLKFYLPDLLWGLSLSLGMYAIFLPNLKQKIVLSVIVLLCGVVWEILQWTGIIGGTGDIIDIIMYLSASILAVIINFKRGN